VTFEEMLEMASLGSKVLQIRSVEFAGKYKVPLRVLSSFQDEGEGTLITFEDDAKMEQAVISGIAFNRDEATIGDANIDVDMIIQNAGVDGMTDFSFTVHRNEYQKALDVLNKQVKSHIKASDIRGDPKICKVSMVGVGMRTHAGIASRMFRTLSEEGINIQMISTSEIKISVVIDEKYMELAVRALHKTFELDQPA
jgi:aspartate kinase